MIGLVVGSPLAPQRMVATGFDSIEDAARKVRDLAKALGLPEPLFVSEEQLMADLAAAKDGGLAAA